jgi:hypothetical protein
MNKKLKTPFGSNIENFLYSEIQGISDFSFLIKMNKIKNKIFSLILLMIVLITFNFVLAETPIANSCCEKTLNGAWCQNAPASQCDGNFKIAPTSCESTSYCKPGCCFDTKEGLCMESTPQRVCEASNGSYADSAQCRITQCQLGCCVLGNQGAFVTLTRCKTMSGFFGLKTDFRKTITNELTCIATAQNADMGACVYDNGVGGKTCKFESRVACKTANLGGELTNFSVNSTLVNGSAPSGFYKDILCTAAELGTDCGKSTKTAILDGKDEVYFTDTCGNLANVYDASRYDDKMYWKKVYKKSESCGAGSSNAGSTTCGNCDYYLGSIGKKKSPLLNNPVYGDYICADLGCKSEGKKHGESWCVTDSPTGSGSDSVGSRYYKEVCLYGEVITEPCADYRNEICIQGETGSFSEAACRVNRWQDCLNQQQDKDCSNGDARDCMWIEGYYYSSSTQQIEKTNNDTNKGPLTPLGLCVPNYPPGFNFWGSSTTTASALATGNASAFTNPGSGFGTGFVNPGSASSSSGTTTCSMGNAAVTVKWNKTEKPLKFWESSDGWECVENCQYSKGDSLTDEEVASWGNEMNQICYKLGDCGGYINWLGKYTDDGFAAYFNGKRKAGSGGSEIQETKKTTQTFNNPKTSSSKSSSSNTGTTIPTTFTNPTG